MKTKEGFMCKCNNVEIGSYDNTITIPIPKHMSSYKEARLKDGLSNLISIDACVSDEILQLWELGIITYGCCCGHNKLEPFVNVDKSNIQQMLDMGYIHNHQDKKRKDTFRLKTK